jgi:hypothetical protein
MMTSSSRRLKRLAMGHLKIFRGRNTKQRMTSARDKKNSWQLEYPLLKS